METEGIINLSTSSVSEIDPSAPLSGVKRRRTTLGKPFAVSFWMDDDLPRKKKNKGSTPFDPNTVPLYDRGGFSFTLSSTDNLEVVNNASRCFNCGSYSHSLKDCPKPRDNVAVNIARKKQHKSKRHKSNAANPSRYYQKGKYDGLKPGVLDPETRKLLNLGELDPPPWLHRMRKIGYPPRYLDEEDLPSGITIYGDDEIKEEIEEGEIVEAMSIEFPDMAEGPSSITASTAHSLVSNNDEIEEGEIVEAMSIVEFPDITASTTHSYSTRNKSNNHTVYRGHYLEGKCPPRSQFGPAIIPLTYRYRDYDSINAPMEGLGRSLLDRFRRSPVVDNRAFYQTCFNNIKLNNFLLLLP
ncbi:PREDICTED: uncharacterized protein LOC109181301 [Ipomoea nil]|uniref:uncharacterized protein LOC109181301 n=1 Tax=Ipomoea nil TaxID=35883 RepID=UPI00090194F5|nr:PREDICTED: uncharacterized protein LOC109181301 [Ipomoea nil]